MKGSEDFTVEHGAGLTTLQGVLRLPSPGAYEPTIAEIRARMERTDESYTVDGANVTYMNSSGLRALADLIMFARRGGRKLRLLGSAAVPWQRKTMVSLKPLYEGLTIELS
jgi:hypothetical protein